MTRDEAQEVFRKNVSEFPGLLEQTGRAIDLYVALGMLKLDEAKNADELFYQAMTKHGFYKSAGEQMLCVLQSAGLKIVKA